MSPSGNHIYVADRGAGKIRKYDRTGRLALSWGEPGPGADQFADPPHDVAVDQLGNVWVGAGGPVKKFDSSGQYLLKSDVVYGTVAVATDGDIIAGEKAGLLYQTDDFYRIDPQGNTSRMSITGTSFGAAYIRYISIFSSTVAITTPLDGVILLDFHNPLALIVAGDLGSGELSDPQGLAFDADGLLFVVDAGDNRMKVFDDVENDPTFITQWALPSNAWDVTVDSQGIIYVTAGGQVHKYRP